MRLQGRWSDLTPSLARWVVRVAILCLLFNLNFTLVAYWDLFVQEWGTESCIAAFAGPFIGLGCGYLLVSGLRVKDVGVRHATEVDHGGPELAPMLLMMIFPFGADPLVTVSITILNTVGLVVVLLFVLMWRRAAPPRAPTHRPSSQQAAGDSVTAEPGSRVPARTSLPGPGRAAGDRQGAATRASNGGRAASTRRAGRALSFLGDRFAAGGYASSLR